MLDGSCLRRAEKLLRRKIQIRQKKQTRLMRRALNVLRRDRGCEEVSTELPWKALAEGPQEDRRQIEIDAAVETAKNKARRFVIPCRN